MINALSVNTCLKDAKAQWRRAHKVKSGWCKRNCCPSADQEAIRGMGEIIELSDSDDVIVDDQGELKESLDDPFRERDEDDASSYLQPWQIPPNIDQKDEHV